MWLPASPPVSCHGVLNSPAGRPPAALLRWSGLFELRLRGPLKALDVPELLVDMSLLDVPEALVVPDELLVSGDEVPPETPSPGPGDEPVLVDGEPVLPPCEPVDCAVAAPAATRRLIRAAPSWSFFICMLLE